MSDPSLLKGQDYCDWLIKENGYPIAYPQSDTVYVAVYPFMFTDAIILGKIGDAGYDQRWCYEKGGHAVNALIEWAAKNYEDEPQGWHRHLPTGRRRWNGLADHETIEP